MVRDPVGGPHWEGFGKRYGMRLTGVVTGNAMEASLGAIWGEDPRYVRVGDQPLGARIKNIIVMTLLPEAAMASCILHTPGTLLRPETISCRTVGAPKVSQRIAPRSNELVWGSSAVWQAMRCRSSWLHGTRSPSKEEIGRVIFTCLGSLTLRCGIKITDTYRFARQSQLKDFNALIAVEHFPGQNYLH